jgi:hypothetical protein
VDTARFDMYGFDVEAQMRIANRQQHLFAFLEARCPQATYLLPSLPDLENALRVVVADISSRFTDEDYRDLAHALGLFDIVFEARMRIHWSVGIFIPMHPREAMLARKVPKSPPLEDITRRVRTIITSSSNRPEWEAIFKRDRLCRDDDGAERLASDLAGISFSTTNMARKILRDWVQNGSIALLEHSNYPYLGILQRLQRHEASIASAVEDAESITAALRADVVALQRTLTNKELQKFARKSSKSPMVLWDESVCHQPAHSEQRKLYQSRIVPELRDLILKELVRQRGCEPAYAAELFDRFISDGLDALIAWHCGHPAHEIRRRHDEQQIQKVVEPHLRFLSSSQRAPMLIRLEHIQKANVATGRTYNLFAMLRDHPSSHDRRKYYHKKPPLDFLQLLAEYESITPKQAQGLLENVRASGCLGLALRSQWPKLVDPRIWSYIEMFKLGRLNDTTSESQLTTRVHFYATGLSLEPLTSQVVLAIFNHFRKERYANSGEGPQLYGVKRRGSLNIQDAPRLHERWLVISMTLKIQLIDSEYHPIEATCSVILVIDCATQMPMGAWITDQVTNQHHICLGLYQAIWHPGALTWPLRGIPEHILVARPLAVAGIDDLKQAATWLAADVEIVDAQTQLEDMPIARGWIQELQKHFAPKGARGQKREQKLTLLQAYSAVLQWLEDHCFQQLNNDPVPSHLRKRGVALPGFDTPAAGLLLPVTGQVLTIQNGVKDEAFRYTSPMFSSEPGEELSKRSLPIPGSNIKPFIFVAHHNLLHYMTQQKRSR